MLSHQPLTLLVTIATLVAHRAAWPGSIPKGFFPAAGHRPLLGVTEAAAGHLVPADDGPPGGAGRRDAGRTRTWSRSRRSSAPTAPTPPPTAGASPSPSSRATSASRGADEIIDAAAAAARHRSRGSTLYLQSVQDLQIDSRVSRTQYQYTLEDANRDELADWAPQVLEQARGRCRSCATWPATSRTAGCSSTLIIDRDTASRLGISPQAIDDTLYDAFGQRQVSTIFTQLNQYRVILEVKPEFQQNPDGARADLRAIADRRARCRSSAFAHFEPTHVAALDQPPGAVPVGDALVQPGARRRRSATRSTAINAGRGARSACRRASTPTFQGAAQAFQRLARERAGPDPGRAHHRLHRARRALRELHPPDHDPLDAALGRASARCSR